MSGAVIAGIVVLLIVVAGALFYFGMPLQVHALARVSYAMGANVTSFS